jgi:hypothetical protein
MNNIAIFSPGEVLKKHYWYNEKIIFIELENWSLIKNGKRNLIKIDTLSSDQKWDDIKRVQDVIRRFKEFSPIWSRWTDRGDQIELYLRQALIESLYIYNGLKKYRVNTVIFPTGASHHLDSMIIETGCVLAGAKQIFPYLVYSRQYGGKYGRLLPLIQTSDIRDRSPLDINVSEHDHDSDINHLLEFTRSQSNANAFSNRYSKSFLLSTAILIISSLRNQGSNILRYIKSLFNSDRKQIAYFPKYSVATHLKQMYQQRKALKYYKIISRPALNTSSIKFIHGDNLLLAAQYQPEATSFPEGWGLHNHIDIVYELRRKGYKGNVLYKEHPATVLYTADIVGATRVGQYRSRKYYQKLEELGCIFLPPSFELSLKPDKNYWYLPITVSGTLALERSLAGLYTIVTGYPWYKGLPGTINLSEIKSLSQIDQDWKKQDPELAEKATEFLKKLLNRKTILNALGIGSGVKIVDDKLISDFKLEYDALIKALIEK